MKHVMKNTLKRIQAFVLLTLLAGTLHAQIGTLTKRSNTFINSNCNGFLEYLPNGYAANPTQKYPLLIFFMGINSHGPGTDASLENFFGTGGGFIQDQMRAGSWPDAFTVNSQTFQPLVIMPQFVTDYNVRQPTPQEVNDVVNYAIAHYRIDTTRIYLTGNSSGGGPVWDYVGANSFYANRIAAILPFCGVTYPSQEKADKIRNGKVAVWAFHNQFDPGVPVTFTTEMIDMINNSGTPPAIPAKAHIDPIGGHDCWWNAYMRVYTENGMNIYQWMLQYSHPATRANAGLDRDLTLPTSSVTLNGSITSPNGPATYNWQKLVGPASGTLSSNSVANPTLSNLSVGNYVYRLTITDNSGTSSDDVAITVYPPRIEAESFLPSSSAGYIVTTADESGQAVNGGSYLDYTVNVPAAGTYSMRFRTSSWAWGSRLVVKNPANGQRISADTLFVTYTADWERYTTLRMNVNLPTSGNQTIRIESVGSQPYQLNWLQVMSAAAPGSVLPVNLTLFNAACDNGTVKLQWKTSGEQNSREFSVERSADGRSWSTLGTVPSAGQSTVERTYTFTDAAPGNASLYRIAEVSVDGRKTYSAAVRSNCGEVKDFSVYPNPVVDKATVNLTVNRATRLNLTVLDSKGSVVRRQTSQLPAGSSVVGLDMNGLPHGSYTISAQWDNERKSVQVIKK